MQKISTIIEQLTISENSLSTPLLETKVLAARIKNSDLLEWVNQEIKGYEDTDKVPSYRIAPGTLRGSYINGRAKFTDTALPVPDISDDITEYLTSTKIMESCSALEYLLQAGQKNGVITYGLSGNIVQYLQNIYSKQNPYFSLYSASIVTSVSVIYNILSTTRSNLLDLMLKIESEYGNSVTLSELIGSNSMINNFVQNIIYNNGNDNIINTGDGSTLTPTQ